MKLPVQTAHWEIDYQAGHLCVWSKSDGAQECPPGSSHPSHCPTYLGLKDTTGTDKETDWKDKGTTRRQEDQLHVTPKPYLYASDIYIYYLKVQK